MPVQLHTEQLDTPTPRFDYSNPNITDTVVGRGLGKYGPFDSSISRDFTDATFSILYPKTWESEAEKLEEALIDGYSSYYPNGFEDFFRMNSVSVENRFVIDNTDFDTYVAAADKIQSEDDDLAIILTSNEMQNRGHRSPYWLMKALLTNNGIPSQMVMVDRLQPTSPLHVDLQNLIVNIASQIYAKIGGIPWVVHQTDSNVDLIIGVGKSEYQAHRIGGTKRTLGFASAYQSNGAFTWFDSTQSTVSDKDFNDQLTESIIEAAEQYSKREMPPDNIIVHSYKRIGPAEKEAKERLEGMFNEPDVTLAHLNDSHDFRIYDPNDKTGLSERGLWTRTGQNKGFVLTGGRRRYRPGSAIPIEIKIEGDLATKEIAQGVFNLCSVYWKDQFGANMPITIKYAEDIADIIENAQKIDDDGLISIDIDRFAHPRIRNIPWFL